MSSSLEFNVSFRIQVHDEDIPKTIPVLLVVDGEGVAVHFENDSDRHGLVMDWDYIGVDRLAPQSLTENTDVTKDIARPPWKS